jgi:hypothetical protein
MPPYPAISTVGKGKGYKKKILIHKNKING